MNAVGLILGALVATFLLSRMFLWLSRNWSDTGGRIIAVHGTSIAIIFVAAGFGFADGGSFRADAVLYYIVPQAIWLGFDLIKRERAQRATS